INSLINEQHFYRNSLLLAWSERNSHPVSLRHLANFGKKLTKEKLLSSANFVRSELPVRLSLKLKELQKLEYKVINNYHINKVYKSYYLCFNSFRRMGRIETLEENEQFCKFLNDVLNDHLTVLPHLMMGALEVSILKNMNQLQLDEFMSSMLRSRISRRVIIEQHIMLSRSLNDQNNVIDDENKPPNFIGDNFQFCSSHEHLNNCFNICSNFLQSIYPNLKMPELIIIGDEVKFQFLTNHLNYIFAEILRNSLKSTIKNFLFRNNGIQLQELNDLKPPPIIVTITQTKKDITFKFQDQGGGMSNEKLSKVWSFGKSPKLASEYLLNFHKLPGLDLNDTTTTTTNTNDLSGMLHNLGQMETSNNFKNKSMLKSLVSRPFEYTLGISLPMCKIYTDYWNGELDMFSIEGYGTDVYLKLSKLGSGGDKLQLDKA
ncbi:hypothetical protein CANARDRAFT_184530, partial [[Candida] arabinofermentans NRRL YB-2248]